MRSFVADTVVHYVDSLVPARHPTLHAMESYARQQRFPIIGPALGHLCYLVTRMTGARRVFELGSGFGYSTAWFARGVQDNGGGVVHHVVWDEPLSRRARADLDAMGYRDVVQYHVGDAIDVLRAHDGPFDLIFNDIDKRGYPDSLPIIEDKLRTGGTLIVDNMLWSGRIFEASDTSPDTVGVREMTRLLTTSSAWITSVLPVRDGIVLAVKR